MSKPEPVAWLYQHDETGRTLLTEQPPDRVDPNDLRRWTCVGGLHLDSALDAVRQEALEEAEDACNSRYKLSGRVEALACAAAIRALIEKESSDE